MNNVNIDAMEVIQAQKEIIGDLQHEILILKMTVQKLQTSNNNEQKGE
jgi:hypothetical protein